MTVAPELFDPEHALYALKLADQVLRAPLGMKTLDPQDMQYRPYYDNSNDSDDSATAKGRNYHQVYDLLSYSCLRLTGLSKPGAGVGLAPRLLPARIPLLRHPSWLRPGGECSVELS